MALQRRKFADIPPDAVVLTEEQAVNYQSKILNNWKYPKDVFGFKYGSYMLGVASFASGFYINSYYRQKFKLLHYGRMSTYLPVCLLPAAFSVLTHMEFVLKDIVLQKRDTCPVCLEMRASALQAIQGCVFPFLLSPLANLSLAQRYITYDVPDVTRQPMKVVSLVKNKTRPIASVVLGLFVGQALIGSAVTYFEAKSVITVNTKLAILEDQLENTFG